MAKIPFDIRFRPQIESGEYRVETRSGKTARIVCWDRVGTQLVVLVGKDEDVLTYDPDGTTGQQMSLPSDLFIVTPEPELSTWGKYISGCLQKYGLLDCGAADRIAKECSVELLSIAREQFIKDGYVIEKKAFHDAVEKVSPEVMKEVSENVDMQINHRKSSDELKKSEDEKIRRWIVSLIHDGEYSKAEHLIALKAVEYLERLKENPDRLILIGRAKSEKQVVLLSESNGNAEINWDTRSLEDTKRLLENGIAFINKRLDIKPVEWSDEDLQHKSWILECLADGARKMPEYAKDFQAAYKWLKSLCPSWRPSGQEKGALRTAIAVLTEERNFPKAAEQLQAILDAFDGKESRKEWKPSDIQLRALLTAIGDEEEAGSDAATELRDLYYDLKKL